MANPDAVLHVEGDAIPVRAVRAHGEKSSMNEHVEHFLTLLSVDSPESRALFRRQTHTGHLGVFAPDATHEILEHARRHTYDSRVRLGFGYRSTGSNPDAPLTRQTPTPDAAAHASAVFTACS